MSAMSAVYIQQRVWHVTRSHDLWHVLSTLKRTITKSTLHVVWRYRILVCTPLTYCAGCTCDFNNPVMLLLTVRWRKYHKVINVDYAHIQHIVEDFIHHLLECGRWVTETEIHNKRFKGPFVCGKCSLPFIAFANSYIVVSPSKIHLREELTTFQLVNKLRNEQ